MEILAHRGSGDRFRVPSCSGEQSRPRLSTQIELLMGCYVRVRPDGIYLVERQFQSGDREVRLAGMMHVARREFYSGVLPPL